MCIYLPNVLPVGHLNLFISFEIKTRYTVFLSCSFYKLFIVEYNNMQNKHIKAEFERRHTYENQNIRRAKTMKCVELSVVQKHEMNAIKQ